MARTLQSDSFGRNVLVAVLVAFVCSLAVSSAVYVLRPIELAYRSIDRNRAILVAAGLAAPGESLSDREIVERFLALEPRLVDLDTDALTTADAVQIGAYDYRAVFDDPDRCRPIEGALDVAGLGRRPQLMPVYVRHPGAGGASDEIERVVVPVCGSGMWSRLHGFVGLGADLATIEAVAFDEQGETPGLGDRIQDPAWTATWAGAPMYAEDGSLVFRIRGVRGDTGVHGKVDAISGATITTAAVESAVRYWFGEDGYGPFLARLRAERR